MSAYFEDSRTESNLHWRWVERVWGASDSRRARPQPENKWSGEAAWGAGETSARA